MLFRSVSIAIAHHDEFICWRHGTPYRIQTRTKLCAPVVDRNDDCDGQGGKIQRCFPILVYHSPSARSRHQESQVVTSTLQHARSMIPMNSRQIRPSGTAQQAHRERGNTYERGDSHLAARTPLHPFHQVLKRNRPRSLLACGVFPRSTESPVDQAKAASPMPIQASSRKRLRSAKVMPVTSLQPKALSNSRSPPSCAQRLPGLTATLAQ